VPRTRLALVTSVFCCAAICAADLAHGVIFALTRAGLVTGPYQSYSHGTVLPTLVTACALASVAFVNLVGEALGKAARLRDDWLHQVAAHISKISPLKVAPALFVVQVLVLIAMERAEQVAALGHPLSLAASLGAPVIAVLGVHAIIAFIVVFAISRACCALVIVARMYADAIAPPILRLAIAKPAALDVRRLLRHVRSSISRQAPLAYHIANRPPPLSTAAVV